MLEALLRDFAERMAFSVQNPSAMSNVIEFLTTFGGRQIVHGHTPIQYVADAVSPQAPLLYADDLCINVDGGIYLGRLASSACSRNKTRTKAGPDTQVCP
ncbi:MAG: hypothetical protein U0521_23335 [Anaerolineae bacterium]